MQDYKSIPVLILAYNRYDKFFRCIESLYKQGIKNVYVSIDGPKNEYDVRKQKKIISFCRENIFNLNIRFNYFEYNLGCRNAPIKGISWFFLQNEYGVVLEDDVMVTNKCLETFEYLLKKNKYNHQIMSVSSFSEYSSKNLEFIYCIPVWRSWGWATWSDRWQKHLDFSKKIKNSSVWGLYKLMPKELQSIDTAKLVKASQLNLLDAWDYEFNFTHIVNKKSSLTLGGINTLVYGFDESATHTIDLDSIGINFDLFSEREFDSKIINKQNFSDNILTLKKCGFFYSKDRSWFFYILNFFRFIYISFIFRLRKIKRIMYKTL